MCLGIPGLVTELCAQDGDYALVEVNGATRRVNIALVAPDGLQVGDWVLIHVGFALARLDEAEAQSTLALLAGMEAAYSDELAIMATSPDVGHPGAGAGP